MAVRCRVDSTPRYCGTGVEAISLVRTALWTVVKIALSFWNFTSALVGEY